MINRIGYACINTSLENNFRDCRLNSIYTQGISYLKDIIIHNLNLTKEILLWNVENNIFMYRATSKMIPFATHKDILKDFSFRWYEDEDILNSLNDIKNIVLENNIRLSMHPDHFTVLNSPKDQIISNSLENLTYHKDLLEMMSGSDLIIHTGGVYSDKSLSIKRFIDTFNSLPIGISKYLRLENDDISYSLKDVIKISKICGIPIVLDIHHHNCKNDDNLDIKDLIPDIANSWYSTNLFPKCHISTGIDSYKDRRHADYISPGDFFAFCDITSNITVDLMVEAKMKELAVLNLKSFLNI